MFFRTSLFALITLASGSAFAASAAKEPFPLTAESTAEFRQQAEKLRNEMASGRYASLDSKDKKRVDKQLDRLDELYVKRGTGASVSNADTVALVNASSEINSVLSGDEDSRLVCEQVKKVGSNRTQKVCMTVAERRDAQREADNAMRTSKILGGR